MKKITKPKVSLLAQGDNLVAKQMQAETGAILPRHLANVESLVFIHEGKINFDMEGDMIPMETGDTIVVPPDVIHQIHVIADFKGVHFMPKSIAFEYFD